MSRAVAPVEYLTIPEIREQYLPLCRQTLQKKFINQPGVLITGGLTENADRRKVAKGQPHRKYRILLVPRSVVERVKREMTVTR
jgi:hypothetical protein